MTQWSDIIGPLKQMPAFVHAYNFQKQERAQNKVVYPPQKDIFNAFKYTPFEDLKVVIIGQDPYHEPNQAMGLSFSVPVGVQIPRSLVNIYKELSDDIQGFTPPDHGNLIPWARQGVLLLNSILTVGEGDAASHQNQGWEEFTDAVIEKINQYKNHVVFILWGNYAQKKGNKINTSKHCVLAGVHPSPLSASRGFFGCKHFSKTNEYLVSTNQKPIDWRLPLHLDGTEEL